jgi:hypothetical protein
MIAAGDGYISALTVLKIIEENPLVHHSPSHVKQKSLGWTNLFQNLNKLHLSVSHNPVPITLRLRYEQVIRTQ